MKGHLTYIEFEKYMRLCTDDEYLEWYEEVSEHLEACSKCKDLLKKYVYIDYICSEGSQMLEDGMKILSKKAAENISSINLNEADDIVSTGPLPPIDEILSAGVTKDWPGNIVDIAANRPSVFAPPPAASVVSTGMVASSANMCKETERLDTESELLMASDFKCEVTSDKKTGPKKKKGFFGLFKKR